MSYLPERFREIGGANLTLEVVKQIKETYIEDGYTIPKYLAFAQFALEKGYKIKLYEAQRTVSKYVTVRSGKLTYKVRFSNHKPNLGRELKKDCDFFVGVSNLETTTAREAWLAMVEYFKKGETK